jgi:DNA-binding NarL/FixJ family response regulator
VTPVQCWSCGETRHVTDAYARDAQHRTCIRCADRSLSGFRQWNQRQAELDEVAVERIIAGTPPPQSTRAEREAAVAYLTQHGYSADAISRRTRMSERTVVRLRRRRAG